MSASQTHAHRRFTRRSPRSRVALAAALVAIVAVALAVWAAALVQAPKALAASGITPNDSKAEKFVSAVSVDEITHHQIALQQIASLNGDTREVFSTGYQESLDYVVSTLKAAGYNPQVDMFNFPVWEESQPPVLNMVSPTPKTYIPGDAEDSDQPTADFITMANSPTVQLTRAPVFPVGGIVDPPTGGSASGCTAANYAGVSGKVALVQRGTCAFVEKWSLAQAAGATGVIIYNEGNTPTRQNPIFVDNQPDPPATIAAVISSYTLGNELLQAYKQGRNPTVDFKVFGTFTDRFLPQVIAETRDGDPDHVVVVGAHLDSVPDGPGINDDGSGTATLLAQAEEIADGNYKVRNKIRFAWWGAEENGLVGSTYYAHNLSQNEVDKIDVMLDYDMLVVRELRPLRLRRRRQCRPGQPGRPRRFGQGRTGLRRLVRRPGSRERARAVRRPLRLCRLHRPRYPGRRRVRRRRGREDGRGGSSLRRRRGSWYDPCYHQLCDNLITVLTGVPALDAEGLAPEGDDAAKNAAQRKMAGGAIKSLSELSGAASYAVYYFAASKDPFDNKPRKGKSRRDHEWHGHNNRVKD